MWKKKSTTTKRHVFSQVNELQQEIKANMNLILSLIIHATCTWNSENFRLISIVLSGTVLSAYAELFYESGLYRQVVSCMLLRSNMGSPTNINVVKETTAALESVLPPEELGTFISLTRSRKLDQVSWTIAQIFFCIYKIPLLHSSKPNPCSLLTRELHVKGFET